MNNKMELCVDLNNLIIFKKISDLGSITKAAIELGLPKSAVSQRLSRLEDELGGRLMQRTTRSLTLTEFGETIYRHAALISEQRDVMMDIAASTMDTSVGLIRMTAPPDLGMHLIRSVLKRFMADHPAIRVELDLSTRFVDLANEGYDLAIRATAKGLEDSNLIASKLHATGISLYGSTTYLAEYDTPKSVDDLSKHRIVTFTASPGAKIIHLKLRRGVDELVSLQVAPTLSASNFQGAYEAIKAGIGVGLLPDDICADDVEAGSMVRILEPWRGGQAQFYVVYPSKKFLTTRVKILLTFLSGAW